DTDRLAAGSVVVHDRRDLVVRADREEFRRELLVAGDVDHAHPVGQAHLLEGHADLASVGRVPGMQLDAHRPRRPWGGPGTITRPMRPTGTGTISRGACRPSARATARPRDSSGRQLRSAATLTAGHASVAVGERPKAMAY